MKDRISDGDSKKIVMRFRESFPTSEEELEKNTGLRYGSSQTIAREEPSG